MPFIATTSPDKATGAVREMYARQQAAYGYVPNYAKVFGDRPEIMGLWAKLLSGIRRNIEPRRFELVTLAAAQALGSSYCCLAHGKVLTKYFSADELETLVSRPDGGSLSAAERAMMRFARKVVRDSSSITTADVEELKAHGFTDADVFDIAATAAGRAFFANLVESLGAEPDATFLEMDAALRQSLTIGRPIDGEAPERLPDEETP
jgi:uncharacterized peroxidase-related enzyme